MKFTPRQYQLKGAEFLKSRQFAMLGDAPGVGKTGQALIAMKPLWKTLIVCPASVKKQWQKALLDWRGFDSCIINSSRSISIGRITIVNYDLIIKQPVLKALLECHFDLIIYDEAHKLKSMDAKRTRVALGRRYLRPRAKRIWFLTGTPVKNRTVDLFPILRSCAPEVLGKYNSYLKFVYRYCGAYTGQFGLDTSGASHTEELHERLKPFMLRREKREVLTELPPRVVTKIDLECSPAVMRIIKEEEEKTVTQAGENDPSQFKLGEIARIRQALAKHKVPGSVRYIKDLLDTENKVVVFFYHKEVLNELRRALDKVPNVFIDGTVHPGKRSGVVEAFRSDKSVRLFFGQMEASGEGIDGLQDACSTCVFVEPSWSHTDIEQCIGRLERSGQRNDVNVHILVIEDTIESRMMDVVAMKLNVDKKLYNQQKGEKEMARKKEVEKTVLDPMEKIAGALESIALSLEKVADYLTVTHTHTGSVPMDHEQVVEGVEEPVEVAVEVEEVTEDAVRARAGDVCALVPDGTAKAKVQEVVKKIGGGKIGDLKTPAQRKTALEALDKLYDQLDV